MSVLIARVTAWGLRLTKFASAHALLLITSAVGGLFFAGLTAASADVYEAVAEQDGMAGLDQPVLEMAVASRTPLNEQLVTWFTNLGGTVGMTVIAAAIIGLMFWRWRSRSALILMGVAIAGSLAFTSVGKRIVGRARPPLEFAVPPYEYAFSFPSGHTLNSTVIAGITAYLVWTRTSSRLIRAVAVVAAIAWSAAMGWSRVFLGHHWLTDVVFAWLLGLAWLTLLITIHRVFLHVREVQRRIGGTAAMNGRTD